MSSSAILDYSPPSLSFRGAVDITSAEYGSTLYNLYYDASLVSLGSVLMFEVKTIEENISVPTPNNVSLSFISIENATNTGISNQWQIAVPSTNDSYDPNVAVRIAVRVYIGITGTAEVGVTKWSNELEVHNPPAQPVIRDAFYNTPGDEDDLYIFLDLSENPYLTDASLKFVAAFYYQNADGATVWDVSAPLAAQDVSNNITYMIHVPNFGFVSTVEGLNVVYTSLYAVYEFQDASSNNFYSVSHVSDTVSATPAEDEAPVVTSINYAVYDPSSNQTMTVFWSAPANEDIPAFNVDSYNVYVSTTDASGSYVMDASGVTDLFYTYDVSEYPCGTTVYFKVQAVLTDGSTSPLSVTNNNSHLNIFYYADAPTNISVSDTSYDSSGSVISMNVSFFGPTDTGCGVPYQFVINILDPSGNIQDSVFVPYDASDNFYQEFYTGSGISQSGTVEVYLQTYDTNPNTDPSLNDLQNGASDTAPYLAVNFDINPVIYQVYVDGSQDMLLSWNDPALEGWTTTNYLLQYQALSSPAPEPLGTWTDITDLSGNVTNYTYDASANSCDTTLFFRVIATIESGLSTNTVTSGYTSVNMFRYADAPTDLVITNTSYNGDSVDMTVNFTGPANEGCGAPLNFVVIIDTQSFDVSYNTIEGPGATYSVVYTDLEVSQTGTVEVYLVTQDTNGNGPQDGASISTPYIATDLVLDTVDYQVYVNGSQDMVLTWDMQVINGWTTSYDVQFQVQTPQETSINPDDWQDAPDGTDLSSTTYTFDASYVDCDSTVYFRIVATLVNGPVTYETISDPVSINMFRYASAPQYANVLWASADGSYNYMDIRMVFTNPSSIGCGAGSNFVVNVLDASGNILTNYETGLPATQDVSYNELAPAYTVNFNEVTYAPIGNVQVYLVTTDTNNEGINRDGAANNAGYIAGRLPIYQDVSMNVGRTLLTFNVITQTPLVLVNNAITGEEVGGLPALTAYRWYIDNTTLGVTVVVDVLANNELQYSITMDPTVVGSPFPNPFPIPWGLIVSNQVGIQEYNVDE